MLSVETLERHDDDLIPGYNLCIVTDVPSPLDT